MNCIHETDAWWWHFAASLTIEKGDAYNAIAESYADSEKGITDKRHWGSMATKTVIITKITRTWNDETMVNHIVKAKKQNAYVKKEDFFVSWQKQGRHDWSDQHNSD